MQRYNINDDAAMRNLEEEPPKVWEESPEKRQEALRKRKEFMVLQARRSVGHHPTLWFYIYLRNGSWK